MVSHQADFGGTWGDLDVHAGQPMRDKDGFCDGQRGTLQRDAGRLSWRQPPGARKLAGPASQEQEWESLLDCSSSENQSLLTPSLPPQPSWSCPSPPAGSWSASYPFPSWLITGHGMEFPELHRRTLVFIQFTKTSFPSANSKLPTHPSPPLPLSNRKARCLCLFCR